MSKNKPVSKKYLRRLQAFVSAFQSIEGDILNYDEEFLSQFPSRKEQAEKFIIKALDNIVLPKAKEVLDEMNKKEERKDGNS